MEIMQNHADLLREIDIIENQIEQLELSARYWTGDSNVLVLAGKGAHKYGLGVAAESADRIHKKINNLQGMLEKYIMIRDTNERRINGFQGLQYKIAKLRYVNGMSYKEIADELGYSYSHIRNVASELRNTVHSQYNTH